MATPLCSPWCFLCWLTKLYWIIMSSDNYMHSLYVYICMNESWLLTSGSIVSSWKFQESLLWTEKGVHTKGQGQRSKVKATGVKNPLSRFRIVTPVWIHIWWWNDSQSLMLHRSRSYCFKRSSVKFICHTAQISPFFTQSQCFPT